MKTFVSVVSLILVIGHYSPRILASETNTTYLRILQASNNVQAVVSALPDIENLWPQAPDDYLKSVNQAVHVLGGALNSPGTKLAFINTFSNMMQKPCPTNAVEATSWVKLKCDTILFGLNFDEIRNDKSQWIGIAKFIGEIRSQMIPHYRNKGVLLNGFGFTSQEIAQNQQNLAEDRFQAMLRQTDNRLIFFLRDSFVRFPSDNPTNKDFAKEIISAAHLSNEEIRKLEVKSY